MARKAEIKRLSVLAAKEAARAKLEASASYSYNHSPSPNPADSVSATAPTVPISTNYQKASDSNFKGNGFDVYLVDLCLLILGVSCWHVLDVLDFKEELMKTRRTQLFSVFDNKFLLKRVISPTPVDPIDVFWLEGLLKHETGKGVFDSGMDPGFLDVLEKHPENSDRVKNMHTCSRPSIALLPHSRLKWRKDALYHAQPTQADGYCFLNNAGLAVQLALDSGCQKVAVVDIDVHYGNGTAEGFYRSNKVLTISLHMNHGTWGPSHPQNGSVDELGEGEGFGYNMNIPLPNGTGDNTFLIGTSDQE
ncbi:histone deacetylase 8-like [Castanea sativa]|uniref:histone deacetylase 8-like n=1 Tax=Castanea sativa TaxID=21020 RepID=UPI003F651AC4